MGRTLEEVRTIRHGTRSPEIQTPGPYPPQFPIAKEVSGLMEHSRTTVGGTVLLSRSHVTFRGPRLD